MTAIFFSAALIAGGLIHRLIFSMIQKWSATHQGGFDWVVLLHLKRPLFYLILLAIAQSFLPLANFKEPLFSGLSHGLLLAAIACLGWLLVGATEVIKDIILKRYDQVETLHGRRIRTQLILINRMLLTVIAVLVIGAMLMTFESVKTIGTGLFASAGIAGIIVGAAANGVLKNLLAGLQIALTDLIRLGDTVVVEGETGQIEEIQASYVVVKIWDLRRMVLPLNYFMEKPFQNWTRYSSEMLGTVLLYLDHRTPVEPVRAELQQILESTDLWDRKTGVLQVTDMNAQILEVRCLISASTAGRLFELRCYVREKMVAVLAQRYPDCLPKSSANLVLPANALKVDIRANP